LRRERLILQCQEYSGLLRKAQAIRVSCARMGSKWNTPVGTDGGGRKQSGVESPHSTPIRLDNSAFAAARGGAAAEGRRRGCGGRTAVEGNNQASSLRTRRQSDWMISHLPQPAEGLRRRVGGGAAADGRRWRVWYYRTSSLRGIRRFRRLPGQQPPCRLIA